MLDWYPQVTQSKNHLIDILVIDLLKPKQLVLKLLPLVFPSNFQKNNPYPIYLH